MAYYNNYKPNINQPKNNDYALQYKDHDEFFVKYYELRTKLVYEMSKQARKYDLEGMKALYVALHDLVEWTCDYINYNDIDKKIKIIDDKLNRLSKINGGVQDSSLDAVYIKIKSVWRQLSKDHTKNELIPKVQVNVEEEDPFKDEKDTAKRTMYKVVMKLFENV